MSTERCCGTCRLYNDERGECRVAILVAGETLHLPVSRTDPCHLDELGIEANQIRWWVENPETGEKADKGVVKIEYPEG